MEHESVLYEIFDLCLLGRVVVEFVLSRRDGAAGLGRQDLEAVAVPLDELVLAGRGQRLLAERGHRVRQDHGAVLVPVVAVETVGLKEFSAVIKG